MSNEIKLKKGARVWFGEGKRPFRVRCCNERFAVCTQPFNPLRTVLYTIIDWENKVRGAENLVFGMGAETDEDCRAMLRRMTRGSSEISHRNHVPLDITRIEPA